MESGNGFSLEIRPFSRSHVVCGGGPGLRAKTASFPAAGFRSGIKKSSGLAAKGISLTMARAVYNRKKINASFCFYL